MLMNVKIILPVVFFLSLTSGCSSLKEFKNGFLKLTGSQQIASQQIVQGSKPKVTKPATVKVQSKTRKHTPKQNRRKVKNNNCTYILMDLSKPSSTAVWCVPNKRSANHG
jgi:hypothetical protein